MIDTKYLDAIKGFEGFTPRAKWDYAQSSNGYGTKALYDGEVIDRAEADRRFKAEIKAAYDIVERFAPNLDDGSKAALTSLTYNAGTAWINSGLGNAVRSGDIETAKSIFQQYNKAGGQVLAGLDARRTAEIAWFDSSPAGMPQPDAISAPIATAAAAAVTQISEKLQHPANVLQSTSDPLADPSALSLFTGRQVNPSVMERSPSQLRQDAALKLANILSILSMSHLDNGAKISQDDNTERRASEIIKHAAGTKA